MRLYVRISYILVFACGVVNTHAQNTAAWSTLYPLPELTALVNFPEPLDRIEQLLEEERNSTSALKAWVYAAGIETSLNPATSGQWDTLPGKGLVWRIGIHAEHALSLNLLIENYRMQPDMVLYVYGSSPDNMAGPFDDSNNSNGGVLPVQSLPGDRLTVEWNISLNAQLPSARATPFSTLNAQFSITSVGYGFRDAAGYGKMVPLAGAAACNVDVNCVTGNHWQLEKRSVVRMETITRTGGITRTQYCSGTLINQAVNADLKKPYILTAYHCISTAQEAQSTTFVFGYEKTYCAETATVSIPAGITGSSLIAYKPDLDFALLELSRDVAAVHQPYYAGWNRSTAAPQSVIGIHHPQGDVKKISVANSQLSTGTFNDEPNLSCDKDAHWIVKRWDEGVTEGGSSGSPIFDAEHRVVGLLSGGTANCSNPVNDYYSKFSEQWSRYPDAGESLQSWLDPDNKGVLSVLGYDPLTSNESPYAVFGHIGQNETKTLVESGEWGYLTGHNDRNWLGFAEKIENDAETTTNIIGLEAHVAKAFVAKTSEPGVKVRFAVWYGETFPATPLYMKDVTVTADFVNYPMRIYFDRKVEVTGTYFVGYRIEYSNPTDTFAVYQSAKRPYAGISSLFVEESAGHWMSLDEYMPPIYSSLEIKVMGTVSKKSQTYMSMSKQSELKIIYKPDNIIAILLDSFDGLTQPPASFTIECYDTSGKLILLNELTGRMDMYGQTAYMQVEMDVGNLPPGLYLIRMVDKKKKLSGKFIKSS